MEGMGVDGGASVAVGWGGCSVGVGGATVVRIGSVGTILVCVGTADVNVACGEGVEVGVEPFWERVGVAAWSVLIAVRKMGVAGVLVNKAPPVAGTNGHPCRATG